MNTKNYDSPVVEVLEIEVESAVLGASGSVGSNSAPNYSDGGSAW